MYGRGNLINLIWQGYLRRTSGDLPIVVVVGPRGSGKTALLDELAARCRRQSAQPFVPVLDLERNLADPRGFRVVAELAYSLSATRWPQFGRLKFPRYALGHAIITHEIDANDPSVVEQEIKKLLTPQDGPVDDFVNRLPELFGLPKWSRFVWSLAWLLLRRQLRSRLAVGKSAEFYAERLRRPPNSGTAGLVELSRLGTEKKPASEATVDRVLCEAFLADLAENYAHGFRPTNCLALVDNVHTKTGRAFQAALASALTERAGRRTPLTVVATSRHLDPVSTGGAVDYVSLWNQASDDRTAGVDDWLDRHATHPRSWLYPIRLSDLTEDEVRDRCRDLGLDPSGRQLAPFVWSLTRGHPWGVVKVSDALDELGARQRELTEAELSGVFEATCPDDAARLGDLAADYLLQDLPKHVKPMTIAASVARDLVAAEAAIASTQGLQGELAPLCWLRGHPPALHPWPRRVLLHTLTHSKLRNPSWSGVCAQLLATHPEGSPERGYYELATGDLAGTVLRLNELLDKLDAGDWIAELDAVTSAPHGNSDACTARTRHGELKDALLQAGPRELPERDEHGDRWTTVVSLTAARWIWSDPLCDPALEMNSIIANELRTWPEGTRRASCD